MPSDRYHRAIEACAEQHRTTKTFSGNGCLKYLHRITDIAARTRSITLLDYGCGKGDQYKKPMPGSTMRMDEIWNVTKYDPAVPEFCALPTGTFDFVWCIDVLECIPEDDIPVILRRLANYATKALFIAVSTLPSKKTLPDGQNAHITQRPKEWWYERFMEIAPTKEGFVMETAVTI